ncbi:MAG TPA: hypothetical protein VKZ79_02220 [Alphaproteobacteria bacterium]|nr:hypothetical protein [Alphaproteobacteria bacterium]
MTADPPKPEGQPATKILNLPTDEELRAAYAEYIAAVGAVAHVWNYLHEQLGQLFSLVMGGDYNRTLAVWYAIPDDRQQRKLLRAALEASAKDRWKPRLPKARRHLFWLLQETDDLADRRNDAIHAPCSIYVGEDGHGMGPAFFNGNPRARKLKGRNIVQEFTWCSARAEQLSQFAERARSALISEDFAWPSRPAPPECGDRTSRQGQGRPTRPKSPSPLPPSSLG